MKEIVSVCACMGRCTCIYTVSLIVLNNLQTAGMGWFLSPGFQCGANKPLTIESVLYELLERDSDMNTFFGITVEGRVFGGSGHVIY
jgi:hypothetical protein